MRFAIRVKAGAARTKVGGSWGEALVVAVTAPAIDGRANEAVRKAVAEAFQVRARQVAIVSGSRSRDKVVEIDPAPADGVRRLADLRE